MVRKELLADVVECRLTGRQLVLEFREAVRSNVEQFVDLERQCCGFVTFTISPPGEKLTLNVEGPEGAESTLSALAEALSGA